MEEKYPFAPLNEASYYILLSLAAGPKHGYGIAKEIETMSGGKVSLSTSTLYTVIGRLLDQGLIDRSENGSKPAPGPGLPRKIYRLTDEGRRALNAEAARLEGMLSAFRRQIREGGV